MDSKDSSPKTVLPSPKTVLFLWIQVQRNVPAVAPQPQGRLRPLRQRPNGLSDNFNFFKLHAFTFPKELLKFE